jgi:hypothetical protein
MTTVAESIAQVVVSRLEAITEANGFAFDVSQVVRVDRHGTQPTYRHLSIVIDESKARNEGLDVPGEPPGIGWATTFSLNLICRDSVSNTQGKAINDDLMQAAVVKAITNQGAADWYSLGGYAIDAAFGDPVPRTEESGEITGSVFPLLVTFRTSEYDMETQR